MIEKFLVGASCLILTTALGLVPPALAQIDDTQFDFYSRGPYRTNVPKPASILNYDVGEFHTNYAMMERVIERIAAAAPDRVRIFDIGRTNEHRMMRLLAISAPENLSRLEQIKADINRLGDPRTASRQEAERIAAGTPVIVWLNYTIHGNESASFEAMMQVVYQLAASEEASTLEILRNTVALVNVCANPDGHERFVTWYNSFSKGNPEPLASEHREPWSIYGRVNRYRFDLNRDNIASTQVETRNVQRAYLEWNPQVFVDHHGQPSQFFFPPAARPVNPNLPAEQTAYWLATFGRANAAQFDQRRWDFYVREIFDLFYPGYWDSWPSLQGATGMTYETDGGGFKGIRWKRDDDTIVTLRSAIAKHFVASMTTLETASRNRQKRLADYYEFKRTAIEEGRNGPVRRFVLLPGKDPGRTRELVEILLRAGIEVSVAEQQFGSQRAHGYDGNVKAMSRSFPSGSYVVDLAQPQKRLAKALLERETVADAEFLREQIARFERNQRRGRRAQRESYSFYDITAWSLPLAFGVEAYWTEDAPAFQGRLLGYSDLSAAGVPGFAAERLGVVGGRAAVAYIIPYERNGAAGLAVKLLQEGFRIAVATRPLTAAGREWPRGTMVVRVSRNPENLHDRISTMSRDMAVEVFAVNSGFHETGETGVGSEGVVSLKAPKIIIVGDEPVSQISYGAVWWTLDRHGVEFTSMSVDAIKRAELDRYSVIVLPDGSASRYFEAFGRAGVDMLRGWVQRGGTLVCIKGAAVFAALNDVNLTSSRLVGSEEDSEKKPDEEKPSPSPSPSPSPASGQSAASQRRAITAQAEALQDDQTEKMEGAPPELPPIASPSAQPGRVPEGVPGAIMRATIDRTTFLTYGYDETALPVMVASGFFFKPSREGVNAVVFDPNPQKEIRMAGFVWPNNTERLLRGTSYVIDEPTGRGHVVLYAEDPNFRGFWRTMTRLFFNSMLFAPTF